ncbi:amino acid ABC transporter permease [Aeromicrobium sp.]|uniref:amino acid ABC transporter permease n=1 Tax=Aeromicrobium sp. TaxID=1871063 RepID=UPI003D6A914C
MSNASVLFDAPGPQALRRYKITAAVTVIGIIAVIALVVWKLYVEDQFTAERWEPFVTPAIIELLIEGLVDTLLAAGVAIVGAVVFGVIFGVGKLSDHALVRWPSWTIVEFFRAVPLLLLIIFIWGLQGFPLGTLVPLILGLILYNGSVLAEVFRAGINAVPKGQSEAAFALGMRKNQVMRIVLLPQAVKIMLPAIISQCIVALKDTSLGYVILAPGLTFVGRAIWRDFANRLATALVLAAIYIVLNLLLSWLAEYLQRRMGTPKVDLVGGIVKTQPDAGAI